MTIELARLNPAQFGAVIQERRRDGFSATDIDPATAARLEQLFHREIGARDAVREIIADVRIRGDAALREWTYRIDGVDVESVHVDPAAMKAAWHGLEQPLRNALTAAAQRLREFHALQVDVLDRGAGVFAPERLNYLAEFATAQLEGAAVLVLAGTVEPTSFFAYPSISSRLVPQGCEVVELADLVVDAPAALEALADALDAPARVAPGEPVERPGRPTGTLDTRSLAAAIGSLLPEGCVVVDESNTSGVGLLGATVSAPTHEWLTNTGGAIGFGLPAAVGAAVGAGGRRVVCVESDGSMSYTPQALWTMAREGLDVTVVCCANDSYAILNYELSRVGATAGGERAKAMLDLTGPTLDLAATARSYGVPAETVTTADELVVAFDKSLATPGPSFISARLASIFR